MVRPVNADDPERVLVGEAIDRLRAGELLIYPTDTLYALGGRAQDVGVALRVREVKGRGDSKPLPLIAGGLDQARSLWAVCPNAVDALAAHFWPGPLTLVLPASELVPGEVLGEASSVAVRVPGSALARSLCAEAGPLISTSANRAGAPPPRSCAAAVAAVGAAVSLALDAGELESAPSTIVDLCAEARLVRPGAIAWERVLAVLGR